jgi:hypothetical protein
VRRFPPPYIDINANGALFVEIDDDFHERECENGEGGEAMSARLGAVRSFDQSARPIRSSEATDMPSERPVALLRDFHALEGEAQSHPYGGRLRGGALPKENTPWQLRATALITLLAPPAASLILLAVYYFEYRRTVPFNVTDSLIVLFLIAIPQGYAFGAVPALLAALFYCALLTAHGRLLRSLIRACVAAICGGLSSWAWFCESLGASGIYGLVGALVMAALSVSSPGPGAEQHVVKE